MSLLRRRMMIAQTIKEGTGMEKIFEMTADGDATKHTRELELTDGLYVISLEYPDSADENAGQSIFARIGHNSSDAIFAAEGYRICNITTRKDGFGQFHRTTFAVMDGTIIPITEALYLATTCLGHGISGPVSGSKISMYSQSSKIVPSGMTLKVYRL